MYAVNKVKYNLQMVGRTLYATNLLLKNWEEDERAESCCVYKDVGNQILSDPIITFQSLLLPLNLSAILGNNDAVVLYVICSGASKHRAPG